MFEKSMPRNSFVLHVWIICVMLMNWRTASGLLHGHVVGKHRLVALHSRPRDFDSSNGRIDGDMRLKHTLMTFQDEIECSRRIHEGKRVMEERDRLSRILGRMASEDEVAASLHIDVVEVRTQLANTMEAKSALVSGNMRLVFHIARIYLHRGVSYTDLIQEASVGLFKAIDRYDASKGFRFSTYASWWIRQALSRSVAEKSRMIRLPVHLHDIMVTLIRVENDFVTQHQRRPTRKELSERLGLPKSKVELLMKCSREMKSTDEAMFNPSSLKKSRDFMFGDKLKSGNRAVSDAELQNQRRNLRNLVDGRLSGREATIVQMRYGLLDGSPMTLEQVGQRLNVTRERIRQIESKALSKLRTFNAAGNLNDYYEKKASSYEMELVRPSNDVEKQAAFQGVKEVASQSQEFLSL